MFDESGRAREEAMGITQPAFSRAIQSLEHSFGFPLVDRASKALPPTPEGLMVLQHARRLDMPVRAAAIR
ncbi:hypothetical protein WM94_18720 [Pseudomonas sp. ABFPK]|nr:hypothetical protein WM94_18720 [Pseudomonas sp. ABFPK]